MKEFDRWNGRKKKIDGKKSLVDFHEREMWWCAIGVNVGSEQHSQSEDFGRPVVVMRRFTRDTFLAVPLTTKVRTAPFRVRFMVNGVENDALVLQMRVYDRRRLLRKVGMVAQDTFAELQKEVASAIQTTDPACAGSSEAEANVYAHDSKTGLQVKR
ncbi:MAG TPA: type II toxin-antitoxin system PemK/MazF family toxin [Candidatus Paceibacterota bacterium]